MGLLLTSLLTGAAWSQELWVRNARYEGPVRLQEGTLWVGLQELSDALKLNLVEINGGYRIGRSFWKPAGAPPAPGEVIAEGTAVECNGGSPPMVNLPQFAEAMHLELKPGQGENSFVLTPPFGWVRGEELAAAAAAKAGPTLPDGPVPPLELNKTTPGAEVDWKSMLVRGRINIVHFYKVPEKDAAYKEQLGLLKNFAKDRSDVYLITINGGVKGSTPLTRSKVFGNVPQTFVFSKSLQCKQIYPGHSMNGALGEWKSNPNAILNLVNKEGGFSI